MSSRLVPIILLVSLWSCATTSAGQLRTGPPASVQASDNRSAEVLTLRVGDKTDSAGESAVSVTQLKVPDKARKLLQRAVDATRKNETAKATQYIAEALKIYPRYADAIALRGVLERDGHLEAALADAEKAVEYDPYFALGYMILGSVYSSLGRFDDAIRVLNYSIVLMPTLWQTQYEMSRALLSKGDYRAAQYHIERTYSLVPKKYLHLLHLLKAELMRRLHDNSAAIQELEAYLREEPNSEKSTGVRNWLDDLRAASRHH